VANIIHNSTEEGVTEKAITFHKNETYYKEINNVYIKITIKPRPISDIHRYNIL